MGQLLSNLANGSLVKLNENGQARRFIKLDTDHYGEGTGCTMLRKDCFKKRQWDAAFNYGGYNNYDGCMLDNFCDCIWVQKLDDEIKKCLLNTPIPVSIGYSSSLQEVGAVRLLNRKGFALSTTEVSGNTTGLIEGTMFDYFTSANRRIAYEADTTNLVIEWGLRSATYGGSNYTVQYVSANGSVSGSELSQYRFAPRPAFNLRSDIVVSDTTDSDGCYTVESIPAKSGGGVYVKQNGVWVQAL